MWFDGKSVPKNYICISFIYIFFQANEYQPVSEYPTYLWTNLKAATEYTFFVSACNGYTMECGEPSQAVTGTTEDGKSGPPSDVVAKCKFDNVSDMNYVEVQWTQPKLPNGVIEFYNVRNFIFFTVLIISYNEFYDILRLQKWW